MKNYVMFDFCIKASDEEGMMFSFDSPFSNGYYYCSSNVHSCGGCFAFCAFLSRTVCLLPFKQARENYYTIPKIKALFSPETIA